jgi:hypothetical protein
VYSRATPSSHRFNRVVPLENIVAHALMTHACTSLHAAAASTSDSSCYIEPPTPQSRRGRRLEAAIHHHHGKNVFIRNLFYERVYS